MRFATFEIITCGITLKEFEVPEKLHTDSDFTNWEFSKKYTSQFRKWDPLTEECRVDSVHATVSQCVTVLSIFRLADLILSNKSRQIVLAGISKYVLC